MEIVTYGNVELLKGILDGVRYMFMSGPTADLKALLLVALGVGFIVALIGYAISPQKMVGWYWLASVIGVITVLWIPRTDVTLIDRLCGVGGGGGSQCVAAIPNVPFALAFVASTSSKVGDGLAEMFETTFQSVNTNSADDYNPATGAIRSSYRANGLMFGNKLIREASRVSFPDPNYRFDIEKYFENCAGPDLADGTVDAAKLRASPDIWQTLKDGGGDGHPGGNPGRFTPDSEGDVISCDGMQARIDKSMDQQILAAQNTLGARVNSNAGGDMTSAAAQTAVGDQLSQAYLSTRLGDAYLSTGLGNASMMASKIIKQNAFINAMSSMRGVVGQRSNDPSAAMLGMAEAQAKISTNSGWITSAKVAEEAMPMIRNGIEAILYAGFPIVVLMMLLLTGRAALKLFVSYASALLWIQLWPVLYAVLNYMASAVSARHIAAAGHIPKMISFDPPAQGLTLLTSSGIYENAISDMAVVGYLVLSIPVIAWSLVKGMDTLGQGALAGAAAFSAGSSVGSSEASSGNISLGNAKMDDVRLAPHYGSANYSTWENGFSKGTDDMSARNLDTMQLKKSDMAGMGASFASSQADSLSKQASQMEALSISESKQASETLTAGLARTASLSSADSNEAGSFSSGAHGKVSSNGDAFRGRSVTGDTAGTGQASADGSSRTGAVEKAQSWFEETHGGVSLPTALTGGVVNAGESVGRRQGSTGKDVDAKQVSHQDIATAAKNAGHMDSVDKSMSYLESFMSSSGFQAAAKHGDSAALSMQATYNQAKSYQESSAAHLQKSHQLSEQAQSVRTNSTTIAVGYDNAIAKSIMETDGGGGKFAGQVMNTPGEAGQRVSDIVTGLNQETYKQEFASLAGKSPQENLSPSLPDEDVKAMDAAYKAQGPNASAVAAAREANSAELAKDTAGKGLHPADPEVAKAKGGKGGGTPFAAELTAGKAAVAKERTRIEGQIQDRETNAAGKLDANKNNTPASLDTKGQDPAVMLGRGISNALSTDHSAPGNDGAGTQSGTDGRGGGTGSGGAGG